MASDGDTDGAQLVAGVKRKQAGREQEADGTCGVERGIRGSRRRDKKGSQVKKVTA